MSLEMRPVCERCQAPLTAEDLVFICSCECTYCAPCAIGLAQVELPVGHTFMPLNRRVRALVGCVWAAA